MVCMSDVQARLEAAAGEVGVPVRGCQARARRQDGGHDAAAVQLPLRLPLRRRQDGREHRQVLHATDCGVSAVTPPDAQHFSWRAIPLTWPCMISFEKAPERRDHTALATAVTLACHDHTWLETLGSPRQNQACHQATGHPQWGMVLTLVSAV